MPFNEQEFSEFDNEKQPTSRYRAFRMSAKTSTSSNASSSDISKKVHSYFASLSSASARIIDDVRSISLAHSRRHNHTFNVKGDDRKGSSASSGGWDTLSEKQRAELVIESLVPGDLEQRYRSLTVDTGVENGNSAWSGGPLGPLASFVDPSQTFPLVEISTGPALHSTLAGGAPEGPLGRASGEDPRSRSVVIEEDFNGHKVPITWRDEHAQAFSWYNQSCDPITPSRDVIIAAACAAAEPSECQEDHPSKRLPPPFVNLCGADDYVAAAAAGTINFTANGHEDDGVVDGTSEGGVAAVAREVSPLGSASVGLVAAGCDAHDDASLGCDLQPASGRLSTSVSGGTLDSGLSNASCLDLGGTTSGGLAGASSGGGGGAGRAAGSCSGDRVSRRSSRASTPERRRSPLMRPKHAPPPPPQAQTGAPHHSGHQNTTSNIGHKDLQNDGLKCGGPFTDAGSMSAEPARLSGHGEMSASKESVASEHSGAHNGPARADAGEESQATTTTILTGSTASSASDTTNLSPAVTVGHQPQRQQKQQQPHPHSRPSSAQPATGGKKRQAPKPPVSPENPVPDVPERSSTLSLASVGSSASIASAGSTSNSNNRTGCPATTKWPAQTERPRSSFCPSVDPDQPHILPEALVSETAGGAADIRASPLLQHASSAGLRTKVPPQQLKKVAPPVAPKIEVPRLGAKSSSESIVATPVISDDIPKTGFAFLDNW